MHESGLVGTVYLASKSFNGCASCERLLGYGNIPNMQLVIITMIIIAFKGAFRDFLQSPGYATNCLQHIRSGGQDTMVWKSRATHRAPITCKVLCATWYEGTAQLFFFFFFFFFFFRSPAISLGFTTYGWDFLRMWPFFNPTIKVVTFRLRGWCVLGVFLLLAFTRLGHERQDLLSPCDEMHVCTD